MLVSVADTARDDAPHQDQIVVLSGATWADYQRMLEVRGERPVPRIAFKQGLLEIMSPSVFHEHVKSLLGALVEAYCVEEGIEANSIGSWTIEDKGSERGVEPDEGWQLGPLAPERRPDLVIEVVWTTGGIEKLGIYSTLGVREVWIWRRGRLAAFVLEDGAFVERSASSVFPGLDLALLASFVDGRSTTTAIRAWVEALRRRKSLG